MIKVGEYQVKKKNVCADKNEAYLYSYPVFARSAQILLKYIFFPQLSVSVKCDTFYIQLLGDQHIKTSYIDVPDTDHFNIVNKLSNPNYKLTKVSVCNQGWRKAPATCQWRVAFEPGQLLSKYTRPFGREDFQTLGGDKMLIRNKMEKNILEEHLQKKNAKETLADHDIVVNFFYSVQQIQFSTATFLDIKPD